MQIRYIIRVYVATYVQNSHISNNTNNNDGYICNSIATVHGIFLMKCLSFAWM